MRRGGDVRTPATEGPHPVGTRLPRHRWARARERGSRSRRHRLGAREHAPAVERAGDRGHLHPGASRGGPDAAGRLDPSGDGSRPRSTTRSTRSTAVTSRTCGTCRGCHARRRRPPQSPRRHTTCRRARPGIADSIKSNLDTAYTASIATIRVAAQRTPGIRWSPSPRRCWRTARMTGRYVPYSFTPGTGKGQWRADYPPSSATRSRG